MPIVAFHKWLYNAVGFTVRCNRDTVALTCIKIIPSFNLVFSFKLLCKFKNIYSFSIVNHIIVQYAPLWFVFVVINIIPYWSFYCTAFLPFFIFILLVFAFIVRFA